MIERETQPRIFVDANIWLYAIMDTQDPQKTPIAKGVILDSSTISISTQTINEVCVNIIKNKFLNETEVRGLIESFYGYYNAIDLSRSIIRKASDIRERYRVSYWDSLVLAAALSDGCEQLISEDMHDGLQVDNQITIVNPFRKSA